MCKAQILTQLRGGTTFKYNAIGLFPVQAIITNRTLTGPTPTRTRPTLRERQQATTTTRGRAMGQ
jgi:hypothetical protein